MRGTAMSGYDDESNVNEFVREMAGKVHIQMV